MTRTDASRFLEDIPTSLINHESKPRAVQSRYDWDDGRSNRSGSSSFDPSTYAWKRPVAKSVEQKVVEQKYQPNMRVNHPSWGEGLVMASKILDGEEVVDVAFESVGFKKLIASMAGLVIVS